MVITLQSVYKKKKKNQSLSDWLRIWLIDNWFCINFNLVGISIKICPQGIHICDKHDLPLDVIATA